VIQRNRLADHRPGAAVVEFAFLLPFILILLLGLWEMGRAAQVNQMLYNAAREGARQASTGLITDSAVQQVVLNYLQNAGLPTQDVVVTVQDLTSPGTDATVATWMDQLQVTVSIPFKDVAWSSLRLVTTPTTQLTAQVLWNSLRDQGYPTSISAPAGY
jgi:Flp pilus assembly protein TadG